MTERSSWASGLIRAAWAPSWVKLFWTRFIVAMTIPLKTGGVGADRDEIELLNLAAQVGIEPTTSGMPVL